jgi:enediyne biosynthesis protein E4
MCPMGETESRASRGRYRWGWLLAIGVFVIVATTAALIVLARRTTKPPTWAEIQSASAGGRPAELQSLLERWIAVHPKQGEPRLMLAKLRLALKDRDGAINALQAVPDAVATWAQAQSMLGELAITERRARDAERIFRRVAERHPNAIEPRQRLYYLLSLQQRTAEARALLWEMYRIRDDPRILIDLVLELLLDQQDVRGLPPELEQFVARTPDDPFLRRAWGMALLYQGEAGRAWPHLEAASVRLMNDPAGGFALAECRIMNGAPVQLDSVLGPQRSGPNDSAQWWLFRGRIEETTGQIERAVDSLARAVKLQPEGREAHFRLGQTLKRRGNAQAAQSHLALASQIEEKRKAVRREHQRLRAAGLPNDPQLFLHLGQLCADAGMVPESRAWFEQSLKLDPSLKHAQTELVRLNGLPDNMADSLAHPRLASNFKEPGADLASGTMPRHERSPKRGWGQVWSTPPPPFEDRASEAGVTFRYESGSSDRMFMADTMGGGVGLIDYDNDGWLDIYFVNGCAIPFDSKNAPHPNRLYRNQGDGTFRDLTVQAGVAGNGYGMGCAVGDYDNDGDDDLLVTGLNQTILYRNRGDGTFEDVTSTAGVASDRWTTAAGFGDLDGDGDLDLVVITYVAIQQDDKLECRDHAGHRIHCTPARYEAQSDLLYRNNGDGTFTEISHFAGFEGPNGRGLGLAIADFDSDGKLDMFVANDASPNFLFRNLGGLRFEETGMKAGVALNGSGRATASMGVIADDLDGDGRIDLFITNLVNESSTFFRNLGEGLFLDATLGAGLDAPSRPKTGFGTAAVDADCDGRLDLFVANGHVDDRPWANSAMAQTPLFFWGRDRGRFEVGTRLENSYFARSVVGRGVAAGDLDNDGRVDLVVVHRDGTAALLFNRAYENHWLGLRIRGTRSDRTPVGAQVTCRFDGRSSVRWITGGTGYLSAHDPRLWFGLGHAGNVEHLEIKWPSGRVQSWNNLAADRILEIEEGRDELREAAKGKLRAPEATR